MFAIDPRAVIVDESHEITNIRAKATKAVRRLCLLNSVKRRYILSATPVRNQLMDLYPQVDSAQPNLWGHYVPYNEGIRTSFGTRYADGSHNGYGWDLRGESNVEELQQRLSTVLIRRSRRDVRKELPPFSRQRVTLDPASLEPTAFRQYRLEVGSAVELHKLAAAARGGELRRLSKMAEWLSWAKRDVAVAHARQLAATTETHKIVVFTWYKKTAAYITKALTRAGVCSFGPITGDTGIEARLEQAYAFKRLDLGTSSLVRGQTQACAAFVATLGAAGASLNPLSAASAELFVDLYWVPAVLLQAEGRIDREGQRAASTLAQYLYLPCSIDQIMWEHLEAKAKAIEASVGERESSSLCEALGGRNDEESLRAMFEKLVELPDSALELL